MSYTSVKEVYLRVIDATIARARDELAEGEEPNEKLLATLGALRDSWQSRLLRAPVFDEAADVVVSSGPNRQPGNPGNGEQGVRGSTLQPTPPSAKLYEGVRKPVGNVGRPLQYLPSAKVESTPSVGETGAIGKIPQGDGPGEEPPAKRARTDAHPPITGSSSAEPHSSTVAKTDVTTLVPEQVANQEQQVANGSNVASAEDGGQESEIDDSELESDSDNEADNFILAQHDKVKKGSGKWKVSLRDGIIHLNGRDYLFSKGSCDLDW